MYLSLTSASNAKIQVPLISERANDDEDDDCRVEEWVEAELEKVKPLNLQSSLPASTNKSNRSDFIRSNAWSFRLFLCASSHTPNCITAPKGRWRTRRQWWEEDMALRDTRYVSSEENDIYIWYQSPKWSHQKDSILNDGNVKSPEVSGYSRCNGTLQWPNSSAKFSKLSNLSFQSMSSADIVVSEERIGWFSSSSQESLLLSTRICQNTFEKAMWVSKRH